MTNAEPSAPKWFRDAIAAPYDEDATGGARLRSALPAMGRPREPGRRARPRRRRSRALVELYRAASRSTVPGGRDRFTGHGDSGRRSSYPRDIWAEEVMAVAEPRASWRAVRGGPQHGRFRQIVAAALRRSTSPAPSSWIPPCGSRTRRARKASGDGLPQSKTVSRSQDRGEHFRLVPPQPCENDFILDFIAEKSLRKTEAGYTWKFDPQVFRRSRPEAMHEHLANVRCRVALLRGEHSYVVPPETGEYMYQLLRRNAPVVEIPAAHHHLILDQPIAFVTALRTILADWEHSIPRQR